jgi:Protein of unknown function (DUF3093)
MNEQRIEPQYNELVLPNWSSFLPILGIFPALWLTFLPINVSVGLWSGLGASALVTVLMIAKSARVVVTDHHLQVSNASIERKFIESVTVIAKEDAFAARGRELDPRAWIHFQGSVSTLALVKINDPADPTPYWLFSTRKPDDLKKALGF